ncbi:MAG: hypothetical protein ACTHOU_09045 [Aureliella sp.]
MQQLLGWKLTWAAVAASCGLLWQAAAPVQAAEPESKIPEGYSLVFSEDFDSEASLANFEFSDPKAWRWSQQGKTSGALELFQQSKYETKYRSPFNMAMIASKRCGDFVVELDMKQTGKEYGHRDMCVYFDFQSPTKFYYTHLATSPDANAHNIFIVDEAPRKSFAPISPKGIDWGSDWQHVRVERQGDDIRVYYQDMTKPVLSAKNGTFHSGYVGFGSFDDTGMIDNVRLWSREATDGQRPLFKK